MRLLVAAPRFPWPLDKGDRLTVYNLVQHFSRRHSVALVCFLEPGQDPAWVRRLEGVAERVEVVPLRRAAAYGRAALGLASRRPLQVHYYRSPAMARRLRAVVEEFRPDLVYAHTIRMAEYLAGDRPVPGALGMQISMALNYDRLARFASSPLWRAAYRLEAGRSGRYEPRIAARFDRCLLISEADVAALGLPRPTNVLVNPHGVDFEYFRRSPGAVAEPGRIVFTGNMAYAPNRDAVEWFVTEILPLVRRQVPGARLDVVGADPPRRVLDLAADPAVEVTGRVPDMRPYLERAAAGVDPLRIGAGLQNKVLEGMAMGLPMVITSIANEGIGAAPGEEVLVADDPPAFAAAVARLLEDPGLGRAIGERARRMIEQRWSWEANFADLERDMLSLVAAREGEGEGPGQPKR
jgi:sugar transferase (PEP-CTERM/EpsH1 system associated)